MILMNYFATLNPVAFTNALPGNIAQGLIWGIMALGVYITFRLLDFADLTVDGSFATGGAVTVMMTINGYNIWVSLLCACIAGLLAGLCTGLLHTKLGIPPILAGILTQIALYSINLNIMQRHANQALSADKYNLVLSSCNFLGCNYRGALLVFRNRAGLCYPCHRLQPCNEQGSGYQHRQHEAHWSCAFKCNCSTLRRPAFTVLRLFRCKHGPWWNRHRSCRSYHR